MNQQYLPWLKLKQKVNFKCLFEKQPYTYWFKTNEILKILEEIGFEVIELQTPRMILERITDFMCGGMLYIIARKTKGDEEG